MSFVKKKICFYIGSRANYGSAKSAMKAVQKHPDLDIQVVAAAAALLDKYGEVIEIIEKDGFKIDERVHMIIEGASPITMAKSSGLGMSELATAYNRLKPDIVFVIGDRFEVLPAAVAAAYMNIPVAHSMGGEVSGNIDESIRHAITKFAHIHFPASERAGERIIKMGERPEDVHVVGCPRMDEVKRILEEESMQELKFVGVGKEIDITKPFLFVSQYPVTSEYGSGEVQIKKTMDAIKKLNMPTIMLWPNPDAGSEDVARGMRKYREHEEHEGPEIHFFKNLPMNTYFHLMKKTACMFGNSSSILREGAFIGTPGVLIGTRQTGRQLAANVVSVDYDTNKIVEAVRSQVAKGLQEADVTYGDGFAGEKIAQVLAKSNPNPQKLLAY